MKIELKDARKSFRGVEALCGISLSIASGSKVALIGPNGSGKTTLTRILMGLLECEGEVLIDGRSPFERRAELAARIAYVPQTAPQLSATVGEIVNAIATARGLDTDTVGATAARLSLDLNAVGAHPVRALSGGMRQKLMLALALATHAELFILDEPTASLDAGSRQAFFSIYEELAQSATLILCSHRLEEIQHLVDHVVALDNGRVVFHGPVAEFLDSRTVGVVEVYADSQRHEPWLRSRGFNRGASGAWARTVTRADKIRLLAELAEACDGDLSNIVIRDVEHLDTSR